MTKTFLTAVAAAAVVAAAVAAGAAGRPAARSRPVTEHFFVRLVRVTSGSFKLKPGATLTARRKVFDARGGRLLGRTSELCTETLAAPLTLECMVTVIVGPSTFTVIGAFNPSQTPYHAALVGGTGRYAGAHGTLVATAATYTAESWTITYTR
jgi:hypothetical protein